MNGFFHWNLTDFIVSFSQQKKSSENLFSSNNFGQVSTKTSLAFCQRKKNWLPFKDTNKIFDMETKARVSIVEIPTFLRKISSSLILLVICCEKNFASKVSFSISPDSSSKFCFCLIFQVSDMQTLQDFS